MAELQTKSNSDGTHNPTENQPSQRQVMPVGPSGQWTKTYEKEVMLKEETTRLMQEREDLIADLEECKSELFKRIPPTQVSDDTIQQAIEQIRRAIDSFVFDSMGDAVDDALYDLFQKEQQLQKQKKRKSKNPLRNFIKKADISAWGPYDCSNFYILSVIIQWILDEYVFRKSYPMGITRDQIRCLEEVIKGMRHANQAQGEERIDLWRSETLTALTALPENATRLDEASKNICDHLSAFLSPWLLEAGPFDKVKGRFRRQILDPAIKLHQDLTSSSNHYDTKYINSFDGLSPRQMLDEWILIDADLWQKPRGEKEVGRALYCLHPSTHRLRNKSNSPIIIAKPVIVVAKPKSEKTLNPHGDKGSSLSGMKEISAAIEPGPTKHKINNPLDQERSAQVELAEDHPIFTDNESTTSSRSRRDIVYQRRASTLPTKQEQEYLAGFPGRRLSVPSDPQGVRYGSSRQPGYHHDEEEQSSRTLREDQNIALYTRGYRISGTSNAFPPQATLRQPPGRGSRNASRDKSSQRRSTTENLHLALSPASHVPSPSPDKPRGFVKRIQATFR